MVLFLKKYEKMGVGIRGRKFRIHLCRSQYFFYTVESEEWTFGTMTRDNKGRQRRALPKKREWLFLDAKAQRCSWLLHLGMEEDLGGLLLILLLFWEASPPQRVEIRALPCACHSLCQSFAIHVLVPACLQFHLLHLGVSIQTCWKALMWTQCVHGVTSARERKHMVILTHQVPVLTLVLHVRNMNGRMCRSHPQRPLQHQRKERKGERCDFSVYILWTKHILSKN